MTSGSCAPSPRAASSRYSATPAHFGAPSPASRNSASTSSSTRCASGRARLLDAMIDTCAANNIAARDIAGGRCRSRGQLHCGSFAITGPRPRSRPSSAPSLRWPRRRSPACCGADEVTDEFRNADRRAGLLDEVHIHPLTEKDPEEPTLAIGSDADSARRRPHTAHHSRSMSRAAISSAALRTMCCGRNSPIARRRR